MRPRAVAVLQPGRVLTARASKFHPPGVHGQAPRLARAKTWLENMQPPKKVIVNKILTERPARRFDRRAVHDLDMLLRGGIHGYELFESTCRTLSPPCGERRRIYQATIARPRGALR